MEPGSLPEDAPLWRRHLHADGFGYAWLLCLILVSLGFQLAATDAGWSRVVTIILQGATLLASLRLSGAHRWMSRVASVLTAIAILGALGLLIGSGELDKAAGRIVLLMLSLLAPAAIVRGVYVQARAARAITVRTMFGVLCVYLLIGMAFAFAYGVVEALTGDPFFAQLGGADQSDFLYFSFTSLTTTGYGDLTAAADLGRSFAITEALIGQIYLVTVVALIVSNLGRARPLRP